MGGCVVGGWGGGGKAVYGQGARVTMEAKSTDVDLTGWEGECRRVGTGMTYV